MMGDFKEVFALSNLQAGQIGGVTLWGFTISIFVLGPFVDALGMRRLMRFSLLCHIAGALMMIFAKNFEMLFAGGLVIALGNGTVEAVCNPLVATIYPNRKAEKLNQFHVWFPGGIVIGGLLCFFIGKYGITLGAASWQVKLSLILVPSVIYGTLFTGQEFPATERVQSGLSFGDMVKATLLRPLFLVLFVCMGITASMELAPGRWMGEVMNGAMSFAGDGAGILVLVYGCGLMAILRFFAGHAIERFSPTGLLVFSAIFTGIGVLALTYASGAAVVIISATVFYVGVCYFWPTMLGVAAERIPKGGSLALALLGGWGMAVVGIVAVPIMGMITDNYAHGKLEIDPTKACITQALTSMPEGEAKTQVESVSAAIASSSALPKKETAQALRNIVMEIGDSEAGIQASAILAPADEHGGLMSFRWIASLSIILILIFGVLYVKDKAAGGYKAEDVNA